MAVAQTSPAPKVLKKVPIDFPDEATKRGIERGVLKLQVTVDGTGAPTEITVLDVQPPKGAKIFNEPLIETLKKWRWEGSGKAATFELQMVLTAE